MMIDDIESHPAHYAAMIATAYICAQGLLTNLNAFDISAPHGDQWADYQAILGALNIAEMNRDNALLMMANAMADDKLVTAANRTPVLPLIIFMDDYEGDLEELEDFRTEFINRFDDPMMEADDIIRELKNMVEI